jgi:hypothetical protein
LDGSVILHLAQGACGKSATKLSCDGGGGEKGGGKGGEEVRYAIFPTAEDAENESMNSNNNKSSPDGGSNGGIGASGAVTFHPPFGSPTKKPRRLLKTIQVIQSGQAPTVTNHEPALARATKEAAELKIKLKLVDVVEEIVDRRGGDEESANGGGGAGAAAAASDGAAPLVVPLAYLVKWEGKPFEAMTWVPFNHPSLTVADDVVAMVKEFDESRRLALELEDEANEVGW